MGQWESVPDDEDSPFATAGPVDGLVYAPQETSPELVMNPGAFPAPPPPLRPRPEPVLPTSAGHSEPWRPGPAVDPRSFRTGPKRPNPVKVFLLALLPILLGLTLVLGVLHLYGLN